MKITFTWDDGALEDQRLYELHTRYEIPGMFYIPTRNREGRDVVTPEIIRDAESEYIAFGGHTQNHVYLTELPIDQVDSEIRDNQTYLEDSLGHAIKHFCYPGGHYNDDIRRIAERYYRTTRAADNMYFRYDGGPLVHTTFHFYPRGMRSLLWHSATAGSYSQLLYVSTHTRMDYYDLLQRMIDREQRRENSVIVIWGHSWEIEELGLWDRLEQIMQSDAVQMCKCSYDELTMRQEYTKS